MEYSLNEDLCDLMKDFLHWKEAYHHINKSNRETSALVEVLREELRFARDSERSDRYRDASTHELLARQQSIIADLMEVKDENMRMASHISELEKSCKNLKSSLEKEKEENNVKMEDAKRSYFAEVKDIQLKADQEVTAAKNEIEKNRLEFLQRYQEIASNLQDLEVEKNDQLNLVIAEYEEKLHKCNELLEALKQENKQIRDRASANMSIYQKKLMECEKGHTTADFKVTYGKSQSNTSYNVQGIDKICNFVAKSTTNTQHETTSGLQPPEIMKERNQGITNSLPSRKNASDVIGTSHGFTALEFLETQPEAACKELSVSTGRKVVAFPVIKKKKLFTPTEHTFLHS